MKKNLTYAIALFAVATSMVACKKSSTSSTTNNTNSGGSYTARGINYTEKESSEQAFYNGTDSVNLLAVGGTNAAHQVSLVYVGFYGGAKPTAGSYLVVSGSGTPGVNQIGFSVVDSVSISKQGIFNSTGSGSVYATVAVNSAGKITVTVPTIEISGQNLDNSDPNNTVNTDVTTSFSGTLTEQ